jgi:hypothetical protein
VSLTELFQRHVSPLRWESFSRLCGLEDALERFVKQGREQFPKIALRHESFVAFLARHLAVEFVDENGAELLRAGDLYLACAYGLGDAFAREHLESQHISNVRQSLRYLDMPESVISEILQDLRTLLLEMQDPSALSDRRYYTGRGELLAWLRVTALQKAGLFQRRIRDAASS